MKELVVRFLIYSACSVMLSGIIFLVTSFAGLAWAYWVCLVVAAAVVFVGLILFKNSDGDCDVY